jgi:hypothetical protein
MNVRTGISSAEKKIALTIPAYSARGFRSNCILCGTFRVMDYAY